LNNTHHSNKTYNHRKLSIKKDLIELSYWTEVIENYNVEIEHITGIERRLLKNETLAKDLKDIRRKNTLVMGALCKYEQVLRKEFEYGEREYDISRAKEHEKHRVLFMMLNREFTQLRKKYYLKILHYH
jgi:hypothetical protein